MCIKKVYKCFLSQWGTMHVFFWMVGVKTFSMHVSKSSFHVFSPQGPVLCYVQTLKTNFGHLSLDTLVA